MVQKKTKTNSPSMALSANRTCRIAYGVLVLSILCFGLFLTYLQPRFITTQLSPPPPPLPIPQASSNSLLTSSSGEAGKHGYRNGSYYVSQERLQNKKNAGNVSIGGGASPSITTAWCSSSSSNNSNMAKGSDAVEVQESYILSLLQAAGISVQRGPRQPPMKTFPRTQFERCLLSSSPLGNDFLLAPNELKSKVTLVNPKPAYHPGDTVQFRADLYDGHGHPRRSGGDEVRMRVISKPGQRTSIAAEVKDLGNGSYLGTTLLPWRGEALLEVYVTYPREFLREAVRQKLAVLSSYWTEANFKSASGIERTACLPSLPIPGYDTTCNLTQVNSGMSLFCGRPRKPGLRCQDLWRFGGLSEMAAPDTLTADRLLINTINKDKTMHLIPNNISIAIAAETEASRQPQPELSPCWKRPPAATWHSRAPRGWFDSDGMWHSLECSLPETVSAQYVQRCFRNTTVYLVGDSNLRHWYYELLGHLNCSRQERAGSLHVHKLCEVSSANTILKWCFHARPTITSSDSDNSPVPLVLANLRHHLLRHEGGRVILIVHYFLHLSLYSPSFYVDRLMEMRRYLQDFVQEFPGRDISVVIRGPHAIFKGIGGNHLTSGDLFAPFYVRAWREVFRSLQDRVRFLDYWDMTIAAQSTESHPVPWIKTETVKVLLGHLCEELR